MTKVKRLIEETLHTGLASYLDGEARTGVNYPVLEDIIDGDYKDFVATKPFVGPAGLFYRCYEPTRAMRTLANDTFVNYSGRPATPVTNDNLIWALVGRIHRKISASAVKDPTEVRSLLAAAARDMPAVSGERASALSLAVAAEVYLEIGSLFISHGIAGGVIPASLLIMAGVPRDRVACFGVYYQNPLENQNPQARWSQGFYAPAPFHAMFGVFLNGRWIPVDFTRRAHGTENTLPQEPAPYLHTANFGQRPDGTPRLADYAHPYTMIVPPAEAQERSVSPLLKYIPLLIIG